MIFDKHIGHQKIIELLKKQVDLDNVHHAYLLIGPSHVGKFNLSKYFATLIHSGENNQSVRSLINKNVHPDTIIIHPKSAKKSARSSISINAIHDLQRKINLSPHSSKYKVGIISEAHLMTPEASNAFLKTLEEPTKTSVFILTTSNEDKMLLTILSRCQKIRLSLVSKKFILKNLVAEGVSQKTAKIISNLSSGKPGLAKKFIKKEKLEEYEKSLDLLEEILQHDLAERLNITKKISENNNVLDILDNWLIYFRDALSIKKDLSDIVVNVDRFKNLKIIGEKLSVEQIRKLIFMVKESREMLNSNVSPRLVLENLFLEI